MTSSLPLWTMSNALMTCGKIMALQTRLDRLLLESSTTDKVAEEAHQQLVTAQRDLERKALSRPLAHWQNLGRGDRSHRNLDKIRTEVDCFIRRMYTTCNLTSILTTSYELDVALVYAFVRYPFSGAGVIHVLLLSDDAVRLVRVEDLSIQANELSSVEFAQATSSSSTSPSLVQVCRAVRTLLVGM
jgi:hypothetical protein